MVSCPICGKEVKQRNINEHIDSNCTFGVENEAVASPALSSTQSFFKTPVSRRDGTVPNVPAIKNEDGPQTPSLKRSFEAVDAPPEAAVSENDSFIVGNGKIASPKSKKPKTSALERVAPLAERMRPKTLDEVYGQDLVSAGGVLRAMIEADRVPSMILWGGPGTGKTTIARLIALSVNSRFVEINSTSSGVGECKKLFAEARSELNLTGRKTIIFCDEIHRFSKSQQDVFLGPVESGQITLIGATTENPSFKVVNALLSRCRVFTLASLQDHDIVRILKRAVEEVRDELQPGPLIEEDLLLYLAQFADGDARTALNLLELAMNLSKRPGVELEDLKQSLTKTLVYDRAGDQHYDTISAFHKSVRGNSADAALYYLARMLTSGEDPLYIARRMVVIASEDVGLADNSMLSLATATYSACEKLGMPECRINLAHCTVALCLAPKSTRAYKALKQAEGAVREAGIAALPIPLYLRNAPTRLMKEMGYGSEYKYPPNYKDGLVKQEYLPEKLSGRVFLGETDLGDEVDPDLIVQQEDEVVRLLSDGSDHQIHTADVDRPNNGPVADEGPVSSQTAAPEDWQ